MEGAKSMNGVYYRLMDIDSVKFWGKVDKSGSCWLWKGEIHISGYGIFNSKKNRWRAHRVSYNLIKGKIPDGFHLDHLCRVPACVNPDHLEAVTPRVNILRGIGRGAISAKKTHCQYGHEFAGRNLKINKKGERVCRKCKARWQIEYMTRKKIR